MNEVDRVSPIAEGTEAYHVEYRLIRTSLERFTNEPSGIDLAGLNDQLNRLLLRVNEGLFNSEAEELEPLYRNLLSLQSELRTRLQAARERSHHGTPPLLNIVDSGRPGRPRIVINEEFLRFAYPRRSISSIANLLGVHRNTVRRTLIRYGFAQPLPSPFVDRPEESPVMSYTRPLSDLSDTELDERISQIRVQEGFGRAGISVLHGILLTNGHRLPRERIRQSLLRIDPGRRVFRAPPIRRRVYNVAGPNAVWHHDGQHGLIRFGIVVHGFIDGFSRLITGIQASDNNRGETVLNLFLKSAREYGVPSRIRGDHGVENILLAAWMETYAGGEGTRPYIWGRSVHNTRIERLWVDVKMQVTARWSDIFKSLEDDHGFDTNSESHLWLIHVLFLPKINEDLLRFRDGWNHHSLRRHGQVHTSPAELFVFGMYEHGVRGYRLPVEEESPNYTRELQCRLANTVTPPRMNSVEVHPPYLNNERRFLLQRLMTRYDRWRDQTPFETWHEALTDCRMIYGDDF